MKWLIIIILLAATFLATWRFHQKTAGQQDEIDKVSIALSGAAVLLPQDAAIMLQPVDIRHEMSFWVRYALTPRYVALHPVAHNGQYITMTISKITDMDSVRNANVKKKLWEHTDSLYYYLLTTSDEK